MEKVLTTAAVARQAGVSEKRVRVYADAGLIECARDSAGRRVFPLTAPKLVRELFLRRTRRGACS